MIVNEISLVIQNWSPKNKNETEISWRLNFDYEKDLWILINLSSLVFFLFMELLIEKKNYNSKKEDLEEEDQRQDERNVIL